jgi:aldose 1-epimerase
MQGISPGRFALESPDGRTRAVISSSGASLRALTVDGVDVIEPSVLSIVDDPVSGAILVPWPNRVEGARWMLNGHEQRLRVTEPEFGHANHGLVTDVEFTRVNSDAASVELETVLPSAPGYPFRLTIRVAYAVGPHGITVSQTLVNESEQPAPAAMGAHPYLRLREVRGVAPLLRIDAARSVHLDDTYIPRGAFDVEGTRWDLRHSTPVAEMVPHAAYTNLSLTGGRHVHVLTDGSKRTELWSDPDFAWVQVYLDQSYSGDHGQRPALAIEPMTAPPNAFGSGVDLRWLEPGESWSARWGITRS